MKLQFDANQQLQLDAVAAILKHELHRLLADGIKYHTALQEGKSVYAYVAYDSEVERLFARQLDSREDIKLFVKLPSWFKIDTPVGEYNSDWAILKDDGQAVYMVRETKATRDFMKLRTGEADKVRCGKKHFEALGVPFEVAVTAAEV